MLPENVALVERGYEAFNRRDMGPILDRVHPDVEWQTTVETHRGHDGLVEWVRQADEIFESFEISVVELIDLDERVLAVVRERARGKDSGIEIDHHFAHVWTFRAGCVVAFRSFAEPAEAREAVGLRGVDPG